MRIRKRQLWQILKAAAQGYSENKVARLGAALAFYTALSIAPLIVIALAIASTIYGEQAAQGLLLEQIQTVMGPESGRALEAIVANASTQGDSLTSFLISGVVLLVSASGVFAELQDSLNTIWGVTAKPGAAILETIKARFLSFAMVLGTGFLLLVSLIANTTLAVASRFVGLEQLVMGQLASFALSFLLIMVLFAAIFKVLPDVELAWRDVWFGATVTTLLFLMGKFLIGLYLGHSSVGSAYGAAGSLLVFLVWVYYSAQIMLLGAELTRAQTCLDGRCLQPTRAAVPLTAEKRAQQGVGSAAKQSHPASAS